MAVLNANVTRSPFFRPSTPLRERETVEQQTPGGTKHKHTIEKVASQVQEHKSSILGTTANLVNAIVGSGIVGIPFAIQKAGFLAGVFLAKHVDAPSYETLMEAAFGSYGFVFVSLCMFIMAYGAMLSYLMIVKDTFAVSFGVDPDDVPLKRSILVIISLAIMVPLSCQRDMADLAKTSRISVVIDILLVLCVCYNSPFETTLENIDSIQNLDMIKWDTVFVGLGVLSFAYVCQHSAFIIAGSLEQPTIKRWSHVTKIALTVCVCLALLCGLTGYLGYLDETNGNILRNLPTDSILSNAARAMLGVTMLFVFPMESFVARHVCVVLLFQGRRAHEGEDSSVLNRSDRRILLTVVLYLSALVPALLFEDLGQVLAATGSVGGSCLSYIGPGAAYMAVHGNRFLELISHWWGPRYTSSSDNSNSRSNSNNSSDNDHTVKKNTPVITDNNETTRLIVSSTDNDATTEIKSTTATSEDSFVVTLLKTFTWYFFGLPIWCLIARFGEQQVKKYGEEMALKSPHPLRIGKVQHQNNNSTTASSLLQKRKMIHSRADEESGGITPVGGRNILLPKQSINPALDIISNDTNQPSSQLLAAISSSERGGPSAYHQTILSSSSTKTTGAGRKPASSPYASPSINQKIGESLLAKQKQQRQQKSRIGASSSIEEEDSQEANPPVMIDFLVAIFYILFGIIAMFAGLLSMAVS